jgi:hypothetical protein
MNIDLSGTWSSTADSVTLNVSGVPSQTWAYAISGATLTMKTSEAEGSGIAVREELYAKQ